ncbi:RhtB family transporter [[Actinomadura] parvosata subsp. kistnae]|uniref:RhtB family transporter n=1 Tax=[Actinomadura] parvosata subsp. kistnae TaxID=1909395 RepID=A0A1V0A8C0_9ACTN|nr:LysE family translocator [Nonomuraea sp. ATCC 55076]AQZ66455.1 RhtB family transporter [Nonomuraea sp. ATCC 55076]SPL95483.1 RhtB family transporter [Actinomadura parvosata subsp. kistnae]
MISPATFTLFLTTSVVLVLIPGPNHLYITARGLAQGRSAGLVSALGIELGTLVHIAAAAAGLSFVIARSATLYSVIKWAGVAYLVYLAIRAFTSKQAQAGRPEPQPLRKVFLEGVLVNVFNPKTLLFFLALLPQFVHPESGSPALQVVVFGLTLMLLGLISDVAYALTAGALGRRLDRAARSLRYVSGVVYLGLGVLTAFTGRE